MNISLVIYNFTNLEIDDKTKDLLRFVDETTALNSSLKAQVSKLETDLKNLRANVSELIKIIVPDVDVEAMLIDDLVSRVIMENKEKEEEEEKKKK